MLRTQRTGRHPHDALTCSSGCKYNYCIFDAEVRTSTSPQDRWLVKECALREIVNSAMTAKMVDPNCNWRYSLVPMLWPCFCAHFCIVMRTGSGASAIDTTTAEFLVDNKGIKLAKVKLVVAMAMFGLDSFAGEARTCGVC